MDYTGRQFSPIHVSRMDRRKASVAVFAAVVVMAHVAVLSWVHPPQIRMLLSNLLQLIASLGASFFASWTALRYKGNVRQAWLLVAMAFFLWGCGQAGWTYQEWTLGPRHPAQEPTDLFFFFSVTPMIVL